MKIKKLFIAFLMMLTAFVLVGCEGISQEEYDKVLEDLAAAEADLAAVEAAKATVEAQLTAANTAKAAVEADLAAANTAKTALEAQIVAKNAEIAALEADLDAEEALKDAALAQIALLEAEVADLEDELEDVEADLAAAQAALATAQASITALQAQIAQMQATAIVAPTELEIWGDEFLYVGDTTFELTADDMDFAPANAFLGLIWTSSDPSIASVNQLGQVTGYRGGTVMIRATSVLDPEMFFEAEWLVMERGDALDIATRAANEIQAQIPSIVSASFALPLPSNASVTVSYFLDSELLEDGMFVYATPANDGVVQVTAIVEYGTAQVERILNLRVVKDAADNDFLRLEMAETYVQLALADALAGDMIAADQFLPKTLRGVTINWTSNASSVLNASGVYTRPNDHTNVRLDAGFQKGGISFARSYNVVVKGYTPEEKVAYIVAEDVIAPLVAGAFNTNINLPTSDNKFGVELTWVSKNPAVFSDSGEYVNKDLAEDTAVAFDVTFKYTHATQGFEITQEVVITAAKATLTSKAAFDFLASEPEIPTYFPFGLPGRGHNTIEGLAASVDGHPLVTIEWAGHEDHFDGVELVVQFLRYHESVLTATFKADGEPDAVVEFILNIGMNPDANAIHNTGRYSEQPVLDPTVRYDLINTISYWDKFVGNPTYKQQQYSIGYTGRGPNTQEAWANTPSTFSGYMISINGAYVMVPLLDENDDPVLDEDNNPVMVEKFFQGDEYQGTVMYSMEMLTAYIIDVDENGAPTYILGNLHTENGWNWGVFFVNLTDKVAKIPMATAALGTSKDGQTWVGQGARENALTFDGYRIGWAADAEGNVVEGNGKAVLQFAKNFDDRTVAIPAGGFGMSYKTQFNLPINGVFANVGTQLNIQRFDLAPQNNLRYLRFNHHLDRAEAALDLLEAGSTTTINVDAQLKDAKHYGFSVVLTDFEKAYFDYDRYEELIARRAAVIDARLQALIDSQDDVDYDDEVYLAGVQAVYDLLPTLMPEVIEEMTLYTWLLDEYEDRLAVKYEISYELNGGVLYANTRAAMAEVFFTDMYQHLVNQEFAGLPTFEEFVNPNSTDEKSWKGLMGGLRLSGAWFVLVEAEATFFTTYVMEYYKDNNNHLTVDATATQFLRQPEYNHWVNQFTLLNQMHQAGSMTGRDVFGRYTLEYQWGDLISRPTTPVVNSVIGSVRTVGQWWLGLNPPGTQDFNVIRTNFYTYSAARSQELVDAREDIYTLGTSDFDFLPQPVKPGFTFGGWFLDEELTLEAVFTPAGLGQADVTLYAKWNPEV